MNAITDFPPIEEPGTLAVPIVSIKSAVLAQFADAEKTVTALADKYKRVAYDCATTKGMADAKAARMDLRENGRYAVQRAEAKVKTEVNGLKRIMAGEVERLVGIVRPVEDAIDGQIKAREEQLAAEKAERERQAAEAARIEAERRQRLEDGIATLAGYVQKAQGKTADAMAAGIAFVEKIVIEPAHWQEYAERAAVTLHKTLDTLRSMHATQVKAEADAAELEALRREKAEREAKERAQREREEAERQVRAEFERINAEAMLADARAESERLERLADENRARFASQTITTPPTPGGGQVDGCRAPESQPDGCSGPVSQDQTSLPVSPEEPATLKLGPALPPPCPNADSRTNTALVAWARAYAEQELAAERERCCRVVVVQRDDRMWEVARRTILAIRAGDDYVGDVDDEGLLRA
jgi:hypothetical protein